jgi:hypothetical protein
VGQDGQGLLHHHKDLDASAVVDADHARALLVVDGEDDAGVLRARIAHENAIFADFWHFGRNQEIFSVSTLQTNATSEIGSGIEVDLCGCRIA